jgi:outer membrane protein
MVCSKQARRIVSGSLVCIGVFCVGCQSPWGENGSRAALQDAVSQAIRQELQTAAQPAGQEGLTQTTRPQSDVMADLAPRLRELEQMGPLAQGGQPRMELGNDLTGKGQSRAEITLGAAIASAVHNNLGTQATRLEPAVAAEQLLAAQAIFDWLLFSNADLAKIDEPQQVPVINAIPLGTPFNANETYRFETGVKRLLDWGTQVSLSTDLTRFRNRSGGISFSPDPAYTAAVRLGLTQPLLRGFGKEVNRATIRIAANQRQRSVEQLRADLLQTVAAAENAYWNLVLAWRNLAINEWLVDVGVQVRDVMEHRREFDTKPAQYSDAVARVEQRRADVIRARRQIRAASDALKVIMNDPTLTISSEVVLYPLDDPVETPIAYNVHDAILTAVDGRPEVQQAILDIDDAIIRQRVASRDRLPLLNLSAQVAYVGLDDRISGAYSEANSADFIDYILGLAFEYPLGNHAADANYRASRLRRSSAILKYRQTVQNVIADVKAALRDMITNYELIQATRSFRIAQAENLRTLLIEEQLLAALSPEFLNLKFTRQETLANARRQEEQAIVNFDQSVASLYRAMGIGLQMRNVQVEAGETEQSTSER